MYCAKRRSEYYAGDTAILAFRARLHCTPKLPADGKEKNTGNRTLGDWYIRYRNKKDRNIIQCEYEAYIGIEYMFIVHGCKIGPEYVPIAYSYKQIGSFHRTV